MSDTRSVRFCASNSAAERISRYIKLNKDDINKNEYSIRFNPNRMMEIMHILSNEKEVSNINFHDDSLDIIIESLYKGEKEWNQ